MTQTPPPPWTPADPSVVDPSAPAAPAQAPGPGAPAPAGARRRRRWVGVLLVPALLLVLVAGVLGVYGLSLGRTFDERRHTVDTGLLDAAGDGPMNVLLLGSDSRAGEREADAGERSDTMMLVHVPRDRDAVYVLSILRDSYVEVPGLGRQKINAAVSAGGHELAIETVGQLLGVPIHHLVEVDFEGFRGVTDTLGGVEVCNPTAFSSGQVNPSYYPRGRILLQDTAALRYVRERHAFRNGDVTRVSNQQRYLSGALGRFMSPEILANPTRTTEVVATFSDHLTVDPGFTSATVASLAWQLRTVRTGDIEMFTLPITGDARTPDGQSVVELDDAAVADLSAALRDDDVPAYLEKHEAEEGTGKGGGDSVDSSTGAESTAAEGARPGTLSGTAPVAVQLLAARAASSAPESAMDGEGPCG